MTKAKLEIQELGTADSFTRQIRYYNRESRLDYAGNHVAEIAGEPVILISCSYEESAPPWKVFASVYRTKSGRRFKVREHPVQGGDKRGLNPSSVLRNVKLGHKLPN